MEAVCASLSILDCCKTKNSRIFAKSSIVSHPTSSMAFNGENDLYNDATWKPQSYPLNDVVIFGGAQKIIAKRTKKAMFDYTAKDPKNYLLGSRKLASFVKSFTGAESEEQSDLLLRPCCKTLPENIAISIANRLKCRIMIDAICESGDTTIQFAKYCDQVIAISADKDKITKAKAKADDQTDGHKIDFIMADFLAIRKLTGNLVFLNAVDTRSPYSTKKCSIAKDLKPDIGAFLVKSMQISRSIALKLPTDIDFEELIELFDSSLEKYGGYSKRYCIEIQEIVDDIDNNFGCYMIYFGKCSSIKRSEEYKVIYEHFQSKEDQNWQVSYPPHVIAAIVEKIGLYRTLKYIAEVEEYEAQFGRPEPFFESFKAKLIDDNMVSKEKLEQLIEEERKKPASPNSMKKRFQKNKNKQIKLPTSNTYSVPPQTKSVIKEKDNKSEKMAPPVQKDIDPKAKVERPNEAITSINRNLIRKDSKEFEDLSDTSYSLSVDLFQFSQKEGSSLDGSFAMMTETFEEFKQPGKEKDRSLNNLNTKNRSIYSQIQNKERTNTTHFPKKFADSVLSNDDEYKYSQSISPSRPKKPLKKTSLNEGQDASDFGFVIKET